MTNSDDEEVVEECVDIMGEMLKRFSPFLTTNQKTIDQNKLTKNLLYILKNATNQTLKKKVTQCIGIISVILSNKNFAFLINSLMKYISEAESESDKLLYYMQAVCWVSKNIGYQLAPYLEKIVPLFNQINKKLLDGSDTNNEIVQECNNAIESFITKCPKEIAVHIKDILKGTLLLMTFDPNYDYSVGEEDDDMDGVDWDDGSEYDDSEELVDDDDTSWKVRKSAVKVLLALITTRPDKKKDFYDITGKLVDRFKERDTKIKIDILRCFQALLKTSL